MMRTSRRSAICAMALASMAAVALPAAADAKKQPYRQATFRATISGSQVSTWEYHRPNDKDDPCDASADGYGDQTVRFGGSRKFTLTLYTPVKGNPDQYGTAGRPVVFTTPFPFVVPATADRNGDVTTHASDIGPNCGDNGGADPGYVPPEPDCGTRTGQFSTRFYFHDNSEDADLFVPIGKVPPDRDNLKLEGDSYEWGEGSEPELRNTYERCPFYGDYVEDAGHIYISPAKIREARLFDKKRKKLVISGDHTSNRTEGDTTSKTILAWNLRLKRVK
jgi:hypothetical protein